MNARIEKMSIYKNENVMLIAQPDVMRHFAIFMSCAMNDAKDNAIKKGRIHTAAIYKDLAQDFSKIANLIDE